MAGFEVTLYGRSWVTPEVQIMSKSPTSCIRIEQPLPGLVRRQLRLILHWARLSVRMSDTWTIINRYAAMSQMITHFFNVGHGDCTVIEIDDTHLVVVDSCIRREQSESPALTFLRKWYVDKGSANVDVLCLTHPDKDHYRGMADIIEFIDGPEKRGTIGGVVRCGLEEKALDCLKRDAQSVAASGCADPLRETRTEFERLYNLLTRYKHISDGGPQQIGELGSVTLFVLGPSTADRNKHLETAIFKELLRSSIEKLAADSSHPDANPPKPRFGSANEISIMLWVKLGNTKLLLPGDTGSEQLKSALDRYELSGKQSMGDTRCSIVKAPHHGARCDSIEVWNRILSDACHVVISAGKHGHWQHPCAETLNQIQGLRPEARFYCTNTCPMMRDVFWHGVPAEVEALLELQSEPAGGGEAYHGDIQCIADGVSDPTWHHLEPTLHCRYHANQAKTTIA